MLEGGWPAASRPRVQLAADRSPRSAIPANGRGMEIEIGRVGIDNLQAARIAIARYASPGHNSVVYRRERLAARRTRLLGAQDLSLIHIFYLVERVRDGRSFTTRRVTGVQHGKTIFTLSASFHHPEPGESHAMAMSAVPPPESVTPTAERMLKLFGPQTHDFFRGNPIDIRHIGPLTFEAERDPSMRCLLYTSRCV